MKKEIVDFLDWLSTGGSDPNIGNRDVDLCIINYHEHGIRYSSLSWKQKMSIVNCYLKGKEGKPNSPEN